VFRVGFAYAITAWLIAQMAELAATSFVAPDWVMKMIITMLILGFPVALVMAWAYELTPAGLRRETNGDVGRSAGRANTGKLDRAITIALLLSVAYFGYDKFIVDPGRDKVAIEAAVRGAQLHAEARGSASVAVLPFANMSNDPEQGYLSDGIADEIIGLLSQADSLRVTSRTSSFLFRDRTEDIRDIGKALGVEHILEGSVRRSGNQVRITAQLIDADTGFGVWSATFDREFDDIFTIQRTVAMEVLLAVRGAGLTGLVENEHVSIGVYEDYVRSRALIHEQNSESIGQAKQLLETLVIKAPDDPRVHAALAQAIILDSDQQYGDTPLKDVAAQARGHIQIAQQLSPTLSDAYSAAGLLALFEGSFEQATLSFERATTLAPGDALPWHWLYFSRKESGDIGSAREALIRAAELDPMFPPTVQHYVFAIADVRPEDANALLERFEERWPAHPTIDLSRANIAFRGGELDTGHAHILDYCDKVGYEFGVCVEAQINVYFQLEMYEELNAISQRAVQPPLLDAFLCPVKALLPLTAMAAYRSEDYVAATDFWVAGFEDNPQGRDKLLGASYAVAAADWTTVREILEPEASLSNIRASLIQLHPSHERFALADLAIARREDGDEQGALALIDELKSYREPFLKYHERRLFPARTLYILDMAIAAGDDALEAYSLAYNEGYRFRSPRGEPLLAPWRDSPRLLELQAIYDADTAGMRRNVRAQLADRDNGSVSNL